MTTSFSLTLAQAVRACLLIISVTFAMFPAQQAQAAEQHRNRSVIGKWKLTVILDFAAISALDDSDAKRLIGAVLTIGPTR